jgi:hypothetical protein
MNLRNALVLGIALLATAPTFAQNTGQVIVPGYKSYGAAITTDGAMPMGIFMKEHMNDLSSEAKVSCDIITSCTKKGCWMDVKMANGDVMKVRFKDYGFFVPTKGLEGKNAIMQGTATKEVLDVATLRHYAHDAGKSKEEIEKITEPQTSWTFEAVGVLIKQ